MKKRFIISICLCLAGAPSVAADRSTVAVTDLLSKQEPINLERVVGSSNLLLVGDDHTQPAIKDFLRDNLPTLKQMGFTCLALEMLPSYFQEDLNTWDTQAQQRIRKHLDAFWGDKGPGVVNSLMSLIGSAKQQGIMVMALEHPDAMNMSRSAVNPYWAEKIERCFYQCRTAKMVVFCGSAHLQPVSASMYSILKDKGFSPSVVEFSGLDSEKSSQLEADVEKILGRPVRLATQIALRSYSLGIHNDFMMESTDPTCLSPRWIVYLTHQPQAPILLAQR